MLAELVQAALSFERFDPRSLASIARALPLVLAAMASAAAASTAVAPTAGAGAAMSDESFDGMVPGYSVRLLGPRNARNIPTMKFIVSRIIRSA